MRPMLAPNTVLKGRYQILKVQAVGGLSLVYQAYDRRLERHVAVKEFQPAADGSYAPATRAAMAAEVEFLRSVSDPRVPAFFDHFDQGGRFYTVMELVLGRDLWRLLQEREEPFSEEAATSLGLDLCALLRLFHEHQPKLVYGDLKPENVMWTPDGAIKALDFGTVQKVRTAGPAAFLTPGFAAPELFGGANVSPAADLYSLGAVLFYALTKTPPPPLAAEVDFGAVSSALSPRLKDLVRACLQREPGRRPASAAAVAAELHEVRRWLREVHGWRPCPACGARMVGGSQFCGQCGQELTRRVTTRLPDLHTPEDFFAEGQRERARGRFVSARWYLRSAREQGLTDPALPLALAEVHLELREFDQAVEALAEAQADGDVRVWSLLGRAYLGARRLPEAEAVLSQAVQQQPQDAGLRLLLAKAALGQRRLTAAREQLQFVLAELNPRHAEAHYLLGVCAYFDGDVEGARRWLQAALELDPDQASAPLTLARIEGEQGRLEAAVDLLRAYLARQPDQVEARVQLGDWLVRLGERMKAEEAYQEALARRPLQESVLLKLGVLYHDSGKWERALEYLEKIGGERRVEALLYRAECLRELGRLAEARPLYEEYLEEADHAWAWLGLALCCLRSGDDAGALRCARQVLRLEPDNPRARRMVEELPKRMKKHHGPFL